MKHTFEIEADCASPVRLDKYIALKTSLPESPPSRSALKAKGSAVFINGKSAKLSSLVRPLDTVRIEWEEEEQTDIIGEDIPLDILYEDCDVTVVNKAQGMVTHPAAGHWSGTLANALAGRLSVSLTPDPCPLAPSMRAGIVHRLDKDTSGVIITAKTAQALMYLQGQFKARKVRKEYIAIVKGRPPKAAGVIECRIARDKHDRKRFAVTTDASKGRSAKTIYHCIACYGPYSIMRLRLKTGRTHQIRVHLKHIGCPILGDSIYSRRDSLFPNASLMLHSRLLELCLPSSKEKTLFIAPMPKRFSAVLRVIKQKFPKQVI